VTILSLVGPGSGKEEEGGGLRGKGGGSRHIDCVLPVTITKILLPLQGKLRRGRKGPEKKEKRGRKTEEEMVHRPLPPYESRTSRSREGKEGGKKRRKGYDEGRFPGNDTYTFCAGRGNQEKGKKGVKKKKSQFVH